MIENGTWTNGQILKLLATKLRKKLRAQERERERERERREEREMSEYHTKALIFSLNSFSLRVR